jgi:hypothetical protein
MDKVLDLRFKGQIDPKLNPLFNKIANDVRSNFNDLVSKISEPNKTCIDWWVGGPASRNTLVSPFFHYYCAFHLVDELCRKNYDISEIIVESFALEKILKQYFRVNGKSIQIKYKGKRLNSHFKQFIIPFVKIPLLLFRRIYQCLCAKKTKYLQRPISDKNLTLIDVFVFPGYISKDRYYNGLWDNLNSKERETTFFVPTFVGIPRKKILSTYEELRTADRNFLIKDDYLKIRDLLFATGHYFRLFKIKISQAIVLGIDISSLVSDELRSMRGYSGAVDALLNYCFVKRIKQRKINVRLIVNWFENQVVDKGWNAGFRKFYPESQLVGYRGFVNIPLWLNLYPSKIENDSMVIPTKIAVMGKGLVESTKEFAPSQKVEVSPAFRFQHVWNESAAKPDTSYFTIFVALSIMSKESFNILKLVKECLKTTDLNNLRFWIKPHPTMSEETLKKGLSGKWPEEFILIEGPSSDYISSSDIMISGMSNICLETIALGIPVIVVENFQGLSFNLIPEEIPQDLWRPCRTYDDIENAIEYYRNRSDGEINGHKEIGLQIREDYFEPVTREGVLKLLDIEGDTTIAES